MDKLVRTGPKEYSFGHFEKPKHSTVVIIGAGYSGIVAARSLTEKGIDVRIIEARDRIGGRIWTTQFAGQQIELGGEWIAESQKYSIAELKRYNISLYDSPDRVPEIAYFPTLDGPKQFNFEEANGHLGELLGQLFHGSNEYFPDPYKPLTALAKIKEVDKLSLQDRINALDLPPQDLLWLQGQTDAYTAAESYRRGLTSMAQWWALSGNTGIGWDSQTARRPVGGMTNLLVRILEDSKAKLVRNSPVTAVVREGKTVGVYTVSGRKFTADAVVVAIPANLWRRIHFLPGLPDAYNTASRYGLGVPDVTKFWFRTSSDSGRTFANGAPNDPLSLLLPHQQLSNGDYLSVGFSASPLLDITNRSQVSAAVRAIAPGVEVLDYVAQPWGRDPYSRGGWGMRGQNQLIDLLPAIQKPAGHLVFATGDNADGWNGAYIDGAIESGFRAAKQVQAILKQG